jgi:hypothetical protein
LPYRWSQISSELQQLGQERRFAQAENVAQKAIRQFPLRSEAYYWLAGYLRMFAGTDNEIDVAVRAGRAVEPVLPSVPAEQAVILQDINPGWARDAWVEAIKRAAILDEKERRGAHSFAAGYTSRAIAAFKDDPEWQLQLAAELEGQPTLLAYWITAAGPEAADAKLRDMQRELQFLDALSPRQRQQVLSRWITLPEAERAVAFMEEREAVSVKGEYWPVLARYYSAQGDLPRAVRRVASSCGIALDAPRDGDGGLRGEMAALIAEGNTVAARRLANDAVAAKLFVAGDLAAAMAYYASQEDWASAWKAGSRLATESKIGQ